VELLLGIQDTGNGGYSDTASDPARHTTAPPLGNRINELKFFKKQCSKLEAKQTIF
jgi:hypothetical protein